MKFSTQKRTGRSVAVAATIAALLALIVAPANADDRELFRSQNKSPYLFILLDTSGSMNWALESSNDGTYYRHAYGETAVPGDSDDPNSRAYQAKSAIYNVVKQLPASARVGFATFARQNNRIYQKHWIYKPDYCEEDEPDDSPCTKLPPWYDTVPFPQKDRSVRFGSDRPPGNWWYYYTNRRYGSGFNDPDRIGFKSTGGNWLTSNYVPPAGSNDQYILNRISHFPKLGADGKSDTDLYFKHNGVVYRLEMEGLNGDQKLGDPSIKVRMRMWKDSQSHTQWWFVRFEPMYTEDNDGIPIDGANDIITVGYNTLNLGPQTNYSADNPCRIGWEDNGPGYATPTSQSLPQSANYTTWEDPFERGKVFDRGDMLPWDWINHPDPDKSNFGFALSGRNEFLKRLAPNSATNGEFQVFGPDAPDGYSPGDPIPDFRIARYFRDQPDSDHLKLKTPFVHTPPFAFYNGTPIGHQVEDFNNWFSQWEQVANPEKNSDGDPDYECRQRFLIVLTDGVANCEGYGPTAVNQITAARQNGVRTFVVGFGLGVDAGQLKEMATAGGTGEGTFYTDGNISKDCERWTYTQVNPDGSEEVRNLCPGPIQANSRKALTNALLNLVQATEAAPASFASAAIPTGQSEAQDSIILSSFLPVDNQPNWPTAVNHFIRPLPLYLENDGLWYPDTRPESKGGQPCGPLRTENCFAWNAADIMMGRTSEDQPIVDERRQAPFAEELTGVDSDPDYRQKLGNFVNARRVLYTKENKKNRVPMWWGGNLTSSRLFLPPSPKANGDLSNNEKDFFNAAEIAYSDLDAARLEAELFVKRTLAIKEADDPREENAVKMNWILGDVFHSNPKVIGAPSRYEYLDGQYGFDYETTCLDSEPALDGDGQPIYDENGDEVLEFGLDFSKTWDYTCFFQMYRLRRKVLVVAANDGMLHAFDAGRFKYKVDEGKMTGKFDWGTGTELFAYMPRSIMPKLRKQAEPGAKHEFTFDGTPVIDDVRIDTKHELDNWKVEDRRWRTVAITGLREGGKAYVALDLTQPDRMKLVELDDRKVPVPNLGDSQTAPRIVPSCTSSKNGCHLHRYPMVLWEFQDLDNDGEPADDDGNNVPDLANTWSSANTGRIKVIHDGEEIEKFVAIVGGGIDPEVPGSGDWLYMIDIETGKAIYKRKLDGPVPSEPAAVDIDNNGWIDTVYIGTVAGSMYKVDISEVVELKKNNNRPGGYFIEDSAWEPFKVFDTGGRPIYYPASVVYVTLKKRYALLFGTGEREDIFEENGEEGRFYTIIDDNWAASTVPANGYTEDDLVATDKDGLGFTDKPLLTDNGYVIRLDPDERMITKAFTLAGVTVFSTFEPARVADGTLCAQEGVSNVYTMFTSSGNAIRKDSSGNPGKRYIQREGFIGDPTAEKSSRGDGDGTHGDVLDDSLKEILQTLKDEMPDNCRFSNQTINIKAIRDNTGVEFIAPIPVCQVGKNWKQW